MNYLNFLNNINYFTEDIGNKDYLIKELINKTPYSRIYLGSDWHLFKKEVTGVPEKEKLFDMAKYIIRHNKKVKNDDIFIYLGDLAHKKCGKEHYEKLRKFVNKLNGIKILLRGNHDNESDEYYRSCGFQYVFDTLKIGNILLSHKPQNLNKYPDVKYNIHGHLHEYKVYWDGTDPKRHLGIYTKDHQVLSLKYILDHRKEIEKENINVYKQFNKHIKMYKSDVDEYINYIKKFFNDNPEYIRMNKEERYLKQEEMVRKFLKIPEVIINESLIGWKQTKMSRESYMNLKYKPENIKSYYHFIILNKDNNIAIDLNPDLIGMNKNIYTQGKNMVKYGWKVCYGLYHWDDEKDKMLRFPQDNTLNNIKKFNMNETLETRLTKPISNFEKYVTLYHGSTKQIPNKVIDPAYGIINIGTKLSKPRYSSWWTRDLYFPCYTSIEKALHYLNLEAGTRPAHKDKKIIKQNQEIIKRLYCLDHINKTMYINEKYKDIFKKYVNQYPGYIYEVTVPWNIVGRGHNIEIEEYTLDRPIKAKEILINYNKLNKYVNIKYIPESEIILKNQITNTENHNITYNPNIMEKIIYYKNARDIRKNYRPITRKFYEK